jgi:FYVE zinc finger.
MTLAATSMTHREDKQPTTFTVTSPEKEDLCMNRNVNDVDTDVDEADGRDPNRSDDGYSGDNYDYKEGKDFQEYKGNIGSSEYNEEDKTEDYTNDEEKLENSSDLSFKKKDVKSRTQSFQSVLSTASMKSLKQQVANSNMIQPLNRNDSIISNNNTSMIMNGSNSKNFQSFIQAPVLSSISNLKNGDDIEIGQQLPFNDNKSKARSTSPETHYEESNTNNYEDDTMIQQQKLTLNALKKLSLSPMPIINSDDHIIRRPVSRKNSVKNVDKSTAQEPYQPAEVDLSSFASLTRQPKIIGSENEGTRTTEDKQTEKMSSAPSSSSSAIQRKMSLPRLPEGERVDNSLTISQSQQKYHNDERQNQNIGAQKSLAQLSSHNQNNQQQKVPRAVMPSQDMNSRRISNNIPSSQSYHHSHTPMGLQNSQAHQQQYQQTRQKSSKQLQQIKGLRSPMYVPAVLRKTMNGMSPTSSQTSSNGPSQPGSPNEIPITPNVSSGHGNENHLNPFRLSPDNDRSSSRASIKSTDSAMSMDSTSSNKNSISAKTNFLGSSKKYGEVLKSAPTRKHWLKDETVLECGIPLCGKQFNFFERRHHCRKCGGIYCKEHTSHYLYINHLAQFTTGGRGTLSKVCDLCIAEYNDFIQHEFGVNIAHSTSQKCIQQPKTVEAANSLQTPPKETSIDKTGMTFIKDSKNSPNRSEQLVGSIPANWSWSSF